MDPMSTHGALPSAAGAAPSAAASITGAAPRMSASDRLRAQQLSALFTAQIQESMLSALDELSADHEDGESEEGASVDDPTAALQQAATGSAGASTSAGAADEASTAQQLIALLSAGPSAPAAVTAATSSADAGPAANAKQVAQVAREQGVDPAVAVAMMLVESGGNARAVGDNGTSFGLYQLHEGGMLTAARLTPDQAFDPRTNATVALKSLAHEWRKGPNRSAGEIAAASQRPADPAGYARKVDAAMDRARTLLGS